MVLNPAEKDVKGESNQRAAADPLGFSFPKKANQQRGKNDPRKNQVDDKDNIPCKSAFKEGGKDHCAIGGEKVQDDMAD